MSDCTIWDGPVWSQGRYGMDTIEGRSMTAHRAAWIRANGPIPEGMVVCHACDNGLCVNVAHLWIGTQSDNMRDCSRKGRIYKPDQRGQNNHHARPNLVERYHSVKRDRGAGMSYRELKDKYGIKSNGHLRQILTSDI